MLRTGRKPIKKLGEQLGCCCTIRFATELGREFDFFFCARCHFLWYSYPPVANTVGPAPCIHHCLVWNEDVSHGSNNVDFPSSCIPIEAILFFLSFCSPLRRFSVAFRNPRPSLDLFRLQSNTHGIVIRSYRAHTRHSWICCQRGWRRVQYTTDTWIPLETWWFSFSPEKKNVPMMEWNFSSFLCPVSFLLPFSRRSMASWVYRGGAGVCCWLTGMRVCRVIRFPGAAVAEFCAIVNRISIGKCHLFSIEKEEKKICRYIRRALFPRLYRLVRSMKWRYLLNAERM